MIQRLKSLPLTIINGSQLPFWLSALLLIPSIVIAYLLWHSFTTQLDANHEKRLRNNLQIFELMLEQHLTEFRNTLAHLATDNTIQVTADLDIRSQLERYLSSQLDISKLDFLIVADKNSSPLLRMGKLAKNNISCNFDAYRIVEDVFVLDKQLYFNRTQILVSKGRLLGYLCGGISISGEEFISAVAAKLDGTPVLAWQAQKISDALDLSLPSKNTPSDVVYTPAKYANTHKGMYALFPMGVGAIELGVHIDLSKQQDLASRELWIIAIVLLIVLFVTGYSLHMYEQRRKAEIRLINERERALVTLNSIADAVISTDRQGNVEYLNPAAEKLLDIDQSSAVGTNCELVLDIRSEKNGEPIPYMRNPLETQMSGSVISDAIVTKHNGEQTAIHFSVAKVEGGSQSGSRVVVLHDMARERELKRRLAWKASRDDLTGLLNRGEFRRIIESTIEQVQRHKISQGLLYIDLDEFKIVNDTCGHQAGDRLLRQISSLLRSHTRKSDIVARLGGDEFGILLTNCPTERAIEIAKSLIESINDIRFSFLDKVFHVGASIGLVSITPETLDLEDLLATVDAACYTAKEQGRNRVHIGEVDAQKISRRMEELNQATRIRNALRDNRLELYYQPIIASAEVHPDISKHIEILVRMRDEDGNLVAPGGFIPIAERSGLMQEIDRWVIHNLFKDHARARRALGMDRYGADSRFNARLYSINLSGASLVDPSFLDYVKSELQRFSIIPKNIGFEITETQVITHLDIAIQFINELRAIGCSFLLDDFGSGMSSFGYLKNLPVDYLKIDGQFVKDMCADPIDLSMVRAINDIGHVIGLKTIAEYVETPEILKAIQEMGVDFAQGFGIQAPRPLSELYAKVGSGRPALKIIHPATQA